MSIAREVAFVLAVANAKRAARRAAAAYHVSRSDVRVPGAPRKLLELAA
jgi:hypothetical protein